MHLYFSIFLLFVLSTNSFALSCGAFSEFKKYGGKYYAISADKLTWDVAKAVAENNGGYLAIPDDMAENNFMANTFGGGWIGIYDPHFSSEYCNEGSICTSSPNRFMTVRGDSIVGLFQNFAPGEPSNTIYSNDIIDGKAFVSPLGEHWVGMGQNGQWGDFGNHARENNNPIRMKAIFEFDTKPECAPLEGVLEMDYTVPKCQTQVYDFTAGTLSEGQIFDCQTDIYGNTYCPDSLAECAQEWDYSDGWSVEKFGNVTDYTSQVEQCDTVKPNASRVYTAEYWNCDKCSAMPIHYLQTAIRVAGGSGNQVVNIDRRNPKRGVVNDSNVTIQVGINGIYINVAPGQIAAILYKRVGNATTNVWRSAGGKPMIYVKSSIECSNWVWYSEWEKVPGHWYCADAGLGTSATCPSGYNKGTNDLGYTYCYNCYLTCPDGYSLNGSTCQKTINYSYYEYMCNSGTNSQGYGWEIQDQGGDCHKTDPDSSAINEESLDNPCNSATPPLNNCKRKKFLCQANEERPCSYVDNKWQCSPFPCFGESDMEDLDTEVGSTDSLDKGFEDDGTCAGQIRLFNGKDMRCRSFGWELLGENCCKKWKLGGIAEFLGITCKEDEISLSKYREDTKDKSHYIGEYCSKKLKLGFTKICIQKKKTYCVFNSKLARIIHQQGRPQLSIQWGEPKAPNCKGFTPEEFQKLDFSKMDMSEFYADIQDSISQKIDANIGTTIQQKVNSFGSNLGGGN
jgi:conjugal transfer mating pair stabilization protein TraN